MSRRALADHRPWLLASLIAGVSYFFAMDEAIGGVWLMVWKASAVGFLAIYAARRARSADGKLITLVLALGAAGDAAIEIDLVAGAVLFALGHAVAIALYMRNRRPRITISQRLTGLALLLATPLLAALLARPQENWQLASFYAALLGAMAAAAWTSRFPRYRVGVGAALFVASDLIIFAREAGAISDQVGHWTIWPLYYSGQFLIATGVVGRLRRGFV